MLRDLYPGFPVPDLTAGTNEGTLSATFHLNVCGGKQSEKISSVRLPWICIELHLCPTMWQSCVMSAMTCAARWDWIVPRTGQDSGTYQSVSIILQSAATLTWAQQLGPADVPCSLCRLQMTGLCAVFLWDFNS